MSLAITKVNLPQSKYSLKAPNAMKPIGVTIHETGNIASAMSEISYMQGNSNQTSYHYAVDDKRAVQGLPLNRNGWHAGDGGSGRGNRRTIGVEHCYNWNGKTTTKNDKVNNPKYQKAIDNGIELVANLFVQYPEWGEPKSGVNIWQHNHHSGKHCPQRLREENRWNEYVDRVRTRYRELKGGTVKVTKDGNLYRVQVGAFSNKANAEKLAAELKAKGYPVFIPDADTVSVAENKPAPKPAPIKSVPSQSWTGQTLRVGDRGPAVTQLQTMLSSKKFYPNKGVKNNGVDGIYGADTKDAVERFQTMNSLTVDGIAGKATYNKLK